MKTRFTVALSMLAGAALGATAIQGLHAQAKPKIYQIGEIDVTNVESYTKEYSPKVQGLIQSFGGRILAAGQKVTALEGAPPKPRVVIIVWDSMDQIQAYRNSPRFQEARKIGEKYAKFRNFAVEGLLQ